MNARLSSFLNASRWIAAFLVMIGHVRHLALADYRDVLVKTPLAKAAYFVTGLGHEAVMVFFVISGYLVGGLSITRYRKRGFDLENYTIHRTSRIYTVLIPALLMGGLLDWVGVAFLNNSGLYTAAAKYSAASLNFSIASNLNVSTLLANLAMFEGVAAERLGSNAPLWSLVYEWWYYVMFAAAITIITSANAVLRIISGICFLALAFLLPHALIFWGAMWLVGVVTALYAETKMWSVPAWLGLLVFGLALTASRLSHSSETTDALAGWGAWGRDFGLAVAFAFVTLTFNKAEKPLPFARGHEALANFSYTLYLVHFPLFIFLMAASRDLLGVPFLQQPGLGAYLYVAVISAAAVLYAWLFSLLTEAHTGDVRRFLSALVPR
jgi:peptidoglycan/LPS O-acetylase OafA/YrhL